MLFRPGRILSRGPEDRFFPRRWTSGAPEPTGQPVHWLIAGRAACGVRSVWMRLCTRYRDKVTCPACLESMNPAPSQQPPCGSPAGSAAPADVLALPHANNPIFPMRDPPLVVAPSGSPGGVSFCEVGNGG